jgi:hypothetical protein
MKAMLEARMVATKTQGPARGGTAPGAAQGGISAHGVLTGIMVFAGAEGEFPPTSVGSESAQDKSYIRVDCGRLGDFSGQSKAERWIIFGAKDSPNPFTALRRFGRGHPAAE